MKMSWFRRRSKKLSESIDEQERADETVDPPRDLEPFVSPRNEEPEQGTDGLVADTPSSDPPNGRETVLPFQNFGWQIGQAGRSLSISGLAAIILIAADLLDPGHTKPWHVYACVALYIAGTRMFFHLERRDHRKRRAVLPLDLSGGGRFALIFAALLFCTSAQPATDGFAGLFALAALLLGSMSDGAWIALVAEREGTGFWRAWFHILRKYRDAQKHLWTALTGRDRR